MLQGKIRRGELDRQITFIKPVYAKGGSNQDEITEWVKVANYPTVFSRRRDLAGKEMVIADQLKFVQKTEFIVVYREDVDPVNRIVFEGKVYEIISVTETEQRKMYLQIMANYLDNETWTPS